MVSEGSDVTNSVYGPESEAIVMAQSMLAINNQKIGI